MASAESVPIVGSRAVPPVGFRDKASGQEDYAPGADKFLASENSALTLAAMHAVVTQRLTDGAGVKDIQTIG